MNSQSFYCCMDEQGCDRVVSDRYTAVNCAGFSSIAYNFTTNMERSDYYFQYLISGKMTVYLNNKRTVMNAGDFIVYYPGTRYHYQNFDDQPISYYWVHFSGWGAAELLKSCDIANSFIYNIGVSEIISLDLEKIFSDFLTRDSFFEISLSECIQKLCIDVARQKKKTGMYEADNQIDRVLMYIHQNYSSTISVSELASNEYLSNGYMRTLFRARTGMSPQKYLTSLRIITARQLLSDSSMSIGEVANAVGIENQLYFSRIFKKYVGLSPSHYRDRGRSENAVAK